MNILVIADVESKFLWDYYKPEKLADVDLIISCGDLEAAYLEFLVTMGKAPVYYIPGNHDTRYQVKPPEGCENLDGRLLVYKGVRILGAGGSMRYKDGNYMYTEQEMRSRLRRLKEDIFRFGGVDIFVTHAPARGYGDMEDLPHRGFECFNEMMEVFHPRYMLHGHVHANYTSHFKREQEHPSGTRIINAYERYMLHYDETQLAEPANKGELFKRVWKAFR